MKHKWLLLNCLSLAILVTASGAAEEKSHTIARCAITGGQNNTNKCSVYYERHYVQINRNEGVLEPGNFETPKPACPLPQPHMLDGKFLVFLGSSMSVLDAEPKDILLIRGRTIIATESKGSAISLKKLVVIDDKDQTLVSIDGDGFWVYPLARLKRPDKSTLIVYDHEDSRVFYIRYLNKKALYIEGTFRNAGLSLVVDHDKMKFGNGPTLQGYCTVGGGASVFSFN
jgi:hypothetical protein